MIMKDENMPSPFPQTTAAVDKLKVTSDIALIGKILQIQELSFSRLTNSHLLNPRMRTFIHIGSYTF